VAFTPAEVDYLTSHPLARLATVAPGGQPDVVPVAFEFDGDAFWVGGNGESVLSTGRSAMLSTATGKSPWSSTTWCRSTRSSPGAYACTASPTLPFSGMDSSDPAYTSVSGR
jgi:hypothetical protein